MRQVAALAVAVGIMAGASLAKAEGDSATRAAARSLGYAGVEAYQAGNFGVATEKLEKAYAVLKVPSLGLWSARALTRVGKLLEAADRYVEVGRLVVTGGDAAVQRAAQADAQLELEQLQHRIPSVVIRVEGAEGATTKLTIDGVEVSSKLLGESTPINPGKHRIEGEAQGRQALVVIDVEERQEQEAVLRFVGPAVVEGPSPGAEPAPSPSPSEASAASTRRTLGWVALGGGAAGLIVGGVTGVMAISKRSALDENPSCADGDCSQSLGPEVDAYNTLRSVSTVGFIAGGVLGATGVVLILTAPRSRSRTALQVSPSFISVRSTF
jgi:hypothetical protein